MATKPLTLAQKKSNDMKRTAREVSNMGREGMTMQDPKASQSKAPLQATQQGGSLLQPARTQRQAINQRPVFRSAALSSAPGIAGPAIRSFPGQVGPTSAQTAQPQTPQPQMAQPPPGLLDDIAGGGIGPVQTAQQPAGPYQAPTVFEQQGAPQTPMAPPPIFQGASGDRGPVDLSELPPGFFDEYLESGGGRYETDINVGDYYGDDLATDSNSGDLGGTGYTPGSLEDMIFGGTTDRAGNDIPFPGGGTEAGGGGGQTGLEQLIAQMMSMDTSADRQAAEERAAAAISQAKADAGGQLAGAGFLGSALVPTLSADIARDGGRALSEELLGIENAAADRALQAGGLELGAREIQQREDAIAEVREMIEKLFADDTPGPDDAPPYTGADTDAYAPEDRAGWVDHAINAGTNAVNELLGGSKFISSRADLPSDAAYGGTIHGQELYRTPDGQIYRVPNTEYEGPPQPGEPNGPDAGGNTSGDTSGDSSSDTGGGGDVDSGPTTIFGTPALPSIYDLLSGR